jgi:predicted aldo/keto reductase-like oxidoreductase
MGKALGGGKRQRAFLMTKMDGRTKEACAEQLEQSLKRLGTDHIDLVQMHEIIRMEDAERIFAAGGAMEALLEARKAGKVRFIGFTGHKSPAIHLHMLEVADKHQFAFDAVQMPLNVLDAHYESFEQRVLPRLVDKQIGVLGMKSICSGKALEAGVSAEECLRYALSLPTSVVITGCEKEERVEQAIRVASTFEPLSPVERQQLLARTASHAGGGKLEAFKTSDKHDGTAKNPHWLTTADATEKNKG